MRKINTSDVFKLARILKKVDIQKIVAEFYSRNTAKPIAAVGIEESGGDLQINLGIEIVFSLIDSASDSKTEDAIYELFAGITEKSVEDIKNQSLEATKEDFTRIAEENNLKNFFKSASRLISK